MNLKPGKRELLNVDLTPLIDVVFLLLIFFMVSTTFTHESEIKVDLPKASEQVIENRKDPIELVIDAEGRFFLNGDLITAQLPGLKIALKRAAGGNEEPSLVIRADANTAHHFVVRAMDAAAQVGLVRMSIATVEE